MHTIGITRRGFMKLAGATTAVAMVGFNAVRVATAAALDFVAQRQASVYAADAKVYKLRKSQDNPMVKKLYAKDGFLSDGPCGHASHELLHTTYTDRSARIKALKATGVKLKV